MLSRNICIYTIWGVCIEVYKYKQSSAMVARELIGSQLYNIVLNFDACSKINAVICSHIWLRLCLCYLAGVHIICSLICKIVICHLFISNCVYLNDLWCLYRRIKIWEVICYRNQRTDWQSAIQDTFSKTSI